MIINKWWFYFVDVLGKLRGFAFAAIPLSFMVCIALNDDLHNVFKEDKVRIERNLSIASLVFLGSLLFVLLTPSKETLVTMKVAEFSTYDNVNLTVEGIKDVTDYIFDSIKELGQ